MTNTASNITEYAVLTRLCLTVEEIMGPTVVAKGGLILFTAICCVFSMIVVRSIHNRLEPTDFLMISLFVADVLQSLGAIMNIRWNTRPSPEIPRQDKPHRRRATNSRRGRRKK